MLYIPYAGRTFRVCTPPATPSATPTPLLLPVYRVPWCAHRRKTSVAFRLLLALFVRYRSALSHTDRSSSFRRIVRRGIQGDWTAVTPIGISTANAYRCRVLQFLETKFFFSAASSPDWVDAQLFCMLHDTSIVCFRRVPRERQRLGCLPATAVQYLVPGRCYRGPQGVCGTL